MATTAEATGRLRPGEWRLLAILGLPTFAYALSTTVVTTYLPVLARTFTDSTTVIGLLIGIEGIMALLIALPAGVLSDRAVQRRTFVIAATPVLIVALVLVGYARTLGVAALLVTVFFAAYFVAYEPYRALYPDLVRNAISSRGQSTQAIWRGLGTFLAIGTGGVLFTIARAMPFIAAAVLVAVTVGIFVWQIDRASGNTTRREISEHDSMRAEIGEIRALLKRSPPLRAYLAANALWELSLGALKTFVILYLTRGLGLDIAVASAAVAGVVVFIALAPPVSGRFGDRIGPARVLEISLLVYGLGLLIPFVIPSTIAVGIAAPFIGFGGGVVMTLPYAVLIPLMPDDHHGTTTGLYSLSRGVGTAIGPLLAGVAISITSSFFTATDGYQAMWGVCAAAVLLSIPLLRRVERAEAAMEDEDD